MNNTNIIAPWTGPILESETVIPLTADTINGWTIVEITSLDEIGKYFREGAYLRISNIHGCWLHIPPEG